MRRQSAHNGIVLLAHAAVLNDCVSSGLLRRAACPCSRVREQAASAASFWASLFRLARTMSARTVSTSAMRVSSFGTGRVSTRGMDNERSGVVHESHVEQVASNSAAPSERREIVAPSALLTPASCSRVPPTASRLPEAVTTYASPPTPMARDDRSLVVKSAIGSIARCPPRRCLIRRRT
jgi:hypothetical protein